MHTNSAHRWQSLPIHIRGCGQFHTDILAYLKFKLILSCWFCNKRMHLKTRVYSMWWYPKFWHRSTHNVIRDMAIMGLTLTRPIDVQTSSLVYFICVLSCMTMTLYASSCVTIRSTSAWFFELTTELCDHFKKKMAYGICARLTLQSSFIHIHIKEPFYYPLPLCMEAMWKGRRPQKYVNVHSTTLLHTAICCSCMNY